MSRFINKVCKIDQSYECCKYLVVGAKGFECMKITSSSKRLIDQNWAINEHVAQGDNCKGQKSEILNEK